MRNSYLSVPHKYVYQQRSISMNINHSSITFYCPTHLKTSFDELIKFKRVSRTSIINFLMEQYLRNEFDLLKKDNQISKFISDVKLRNHKNKTFVLSENQQVEHSDDDYDLPLPSIPSYEYQSDNFDWEQRLNELK